MSRLKILLAVVLLQSATLAWAQSSTDLAAMRIACKDDALKLCSNVEPGGGRILQCLKDHKDDLSDACKQASHLTAAAGSNVSAAATSPSPAPRAAASEAAKPASPASAPAAAHAHASSTASGSYLQLKKVTITYIPEDAPSEHRPAVDLLVPAGWEFQGGVHIFAGKEGCYSDEFTVAWEAKNEDGSTKIQGDPNYSWQYSDDPQQLRALNDPKWRTHTGSQPNDLCPVSKPLSAEQYLRQMVLPDLKPQMTVVAIEPFPDLEQLVRKRNALPPESDPNGGARIDAIRARLEFQYKDKPMELWYAVALITQTTRVGRGNFYDMHAAGQMLMGAPKGKLDANDKLFRVVMSSVQPVPEFQAMTRHFITQLYQIQANKVKGLNAIQADLNNFALQTQLHVNEYAQQVSDQGFRASDQNLRNVQMYRDPSTGRRVELSNQFDHAWLNGDNQYVMSDDPNFNPNGQLTGSWNQLQPAPP